MSKRRNTSASAFFLALLMITISMSTTMQSWEFPSLEQENTVQTVSSNSTVNLVAGFNASIETGLIGVPQSGTYEINSDLERMYFTAEEISFENKLSTGTSHTCAIFNDASLKCWGINGAGQLGLGSTAQQTTPQTVNLGTGRTAVSVSLGSSHTCAILDDASLKCWGQNINGQLGLGSTTQQTTPQFVDLGTGRTAVSVSLGSSHTCAILDDASLKCWGYNNYGQLGIGTTIQQTTPQFVNPETGRTAVSVSLGNSHTCAILDDASLKCWGYNTAGQLGIGSTDDHSTPQTVDLGTGRTAVSVSLGEYHTCAILDNASLKCWGEGGQGQLGIGTSIQQTTPQIVDLGVGRTAVSVSSGSIHTCAILNDTSLKCWGYNGNGQLGIGLESEHHTPIEPNIEVGELWADLTLGSSETCGLLDNGSVKCWGYNGYGQLGIGSTTDQNTPQFVNMSTGYSAVSISSGSDSSCLITNNSSLMCWGSNTYGQLGLDSTTQQTTPQFVDLGTGRTAVSVSLGHYHTCAILDDASLKCWGYNGYGQLGIGSTTQQTTPQTVNLGTGRTAVSVSLGQSHTCAILDDASLKCWGYNSRGQLGLGSTTQQTTPQLVNLGTGRTAVSVSLGQYHTCAILDDASLKCWGYNAYGQLGNGYSVYITTPILTLFELEPRFAGTLFGTPTKTSLSDNYTIWANNSIGSTFDVIEISVIPAYDYGNNTLNLVRNDTMSSRTPIITGGPYAVSIQPSLPVGLFFEPSNGSIWGTPIFDQSGSNYSITVSIWLRFNNNFYRHI